MSRNASRIPVVIALLTAGFVTATSAVRSSRIPLTPANIPLIAAAPVRPAASAARKPAAWIASPIDAGAARIATSRTAR